jgi:murein DD-endopeptidase MepM/ murein hydrolase activator NlpD
MKEEKGSLKASRSILRISIADMIALHVRTQLDKSLARPEHLYQWLPTKAMALMATIPFGNFAVSIPHQSDLGGGYPILESPPTMVDGFTVVYARQPNSRYEALKVLFQSQEYEIDAFYAAARQWVKALEGSLKIIPGRYAYFIPTRKLWGVILRDNGYIALDPSIIPSEITPELLENRADNGNMIARVPIYSSDKQASGDSLPVFQQVELTLDPHPTQHSIWTDFVEHQKARAIRAQSPECIIPDFREWMQSLAAESGFVRWIFRPGMLFGDRIEWWGDGNRRRTEHEGLDFAEGLLPDATIRNIPEGAPVRAITDGEIVAFLDDFLGKTVVVRHSWIVDQNGDVFHTLYSHIQPEELLSGPVAKGRLLGRVGKSTAAGAPAHLHLTGAWIPQAITSAEIRMDHIDPAFVPVVLINW